MVVKSLVGNEINSITSLGTSTYGSRTAGGHRQNILKINPGLKPFLNIKVTSKRVMLFHNIIYFNSKMAVTANPSLILRDIRTQILKSVQQFFVVGGLFSVEHVLFSVVFGEGIEHSASEQPGCVQSPTSRPEDFKDGPAGFEHCKLHTLFMDSLDGVSYPGITVTPSSDGAPHT